MPSDALMTRTVLNSWKQNIAQIDKLLASQSDADLQHEVAPGKNRLYYLLGHLTAVNDRIIPLLRLGERLHPELDASFITAADKASPDTVAAADLRSAWTDVNAKLTAALEALQPEQWLERHNDVSPTDFVKEPHRNRLAVVLSRNSHTAFHAGQIRLVAK